MRIPWGVCLGLLLAWRVEAQTHHPFGPPDLIEKARAEGRLVLYTVNFTETEHAWIAVFNKRFPGRR